MNHLAHLLVSNDSDDWIGGALAADEIRGTPPVHYSDDAVRAVLLHRHLDAYTDSHPVNRKTRQIFREHRHYARVLVDVFYDHVLALNFETYGGMSLEEFAPRVYDGLARSRSWLPRALAQRLPRMIDDDFLVRYKTPDHITRTLRFLSSRFSRAVDLTTAMETFATNLPAISANAHAFLPAMIREAESHKKGLGTRG